MCYSEKHFHPDRKSEMEYTSAGQLAKNFYGVFRKFGNVKYTDNLEFVKTNTLFIQGYVFLNLKKTKYKKLIFFFPASHISYTRDILIKHSKYFAGKQDDIYWMNSKLTIKLFDETIKKSNIFFSVGNEFVRQTFINNNVLKNKLNMLNYGINNSHFYKTDRTFDKINFIFLSTTSSIIKGAPFVYKAWNDISNIQFSLSVKLYILGDKGEITPSYKNSKIKHLGKYICGSVNHIKHLNNAHYVISPSLSEGQVGTVLEAMSCGCVPIATKESGINAKEYGGWEIVAGNSENLRQTLIDVISSHNKKIWTERSQITNETISKRHRWSDFNNKIETTVANLIMKN